MTRLHWPASIPGLLGSNSQPGTNLVLTPEGNIALGTAAVSILGRVPTVGDLPPDEPPGSNNIGDAYVVDEDNHLWVWSGEPPSWVDAGPWTTEEHEFLTDVSPDQHHPQVHAHNGIDGSGSVAHQSTTGKTPDDHHPQAHSHAGDGSGSVAHADTTGKTTDDHHNQVHLLYGSDHSDINSAVPADSRQVLATPAGLGPWIPELRLNWRGQWIAGTYYPHDTVKDGDWSMVANKETTDRAAPQPTGTELYVYEGLLPLENEQTVKQVLFGTRYTIDNFISINGYRIYVKAGNHYTVYSVKDPDGVNDLTQLLDFYADITGWREFGLTPILTGNGAVIELLCIVAEPDPTPTTFDGNWDYKTPQNAAAPAPGDIQHGNSTPAFMNISTLDDGGGDRRTELLTLVVGDIITTGDSRWSIQSIADNTTWFRYGVSPAVQHIPDGVALFTFETVTATPISYFEDVDYWLTSQYVGQVEGVFAVDGDTPVLNSTAYGTDILAQRYVASEDWDILATSSGGSGGDGGSGENPLPVGGATDQALTKIDGQDYNVQWTGPYLPLSGGEMSGELGMGGENIVNIRQLVGYEGVFTVRPAAGYNLDFKGGANQVRFRVNNSGDLQFRALDGSTTILLWDESQDRWEFSKPISMSDLGITDLADPVDPQDAATKNYVDGEIGDIPPQTYFHDNLTDVTSDQHHPQVHLTDGADHDSTGAIDGQVLTADGVGGQDWATPVSGVTDHALLNNVLPDQHHVKYTDQEAIDAVGPIPPPQTYLHDDLTDVSADQHHPQLHDLDSHTNVIAPSPAEGQRLMFNGVDWIPAYSPSALGFAEFPYRIDADIDPTPAPGRISGNTDSGTTNTILYINEENDDGVDISLFLDELGDGDWVNIHDPDDVAGTYIRYDVLGEGVHVGDVWEFPVSLFDRLGPIFTNNQRVRIYMRFNGPDPFSGDHDDLSNVTADQHHIKYTDAEAIAAVGPHFSGSHADLTDVATDQHHAQVHDLGLSDHVSGAEVAGRLVEADGVGGTRWVSPVAGVTDHALLSNVLTDQHHARYTDAEAVAAVGDPGAGVYLPLTGGTLSGHLTITPDGRATPLFSVGTDVVIGAQSEGTGNEGGEIIFEGSPDGGVPWYVDVFDDYMRFVTSAERYRFGETGAFFYQHLDMVSNKITSLANPTVAQDAVTKAHLDLYRPRNIAPSYSAGNAVNLDWVQFNFTADTAGVLVVVYAAYALSAPSNTNVFMHGGGIGTGTGNRIVGGMQMVGTVSYNINQGAVNGILRFASANQTDMINVYLDPAINSASAIFYPTPV